MTQARRAKGLAGRGRRAGLLVVIPLVMLLAGLLLFQGLRQQAEQGGLPIPGALTASASASPDVATPTATTPTPSPSPSTPSRSSSSPSAKPNDSAATAALRACRTKVDAGDEVRSAARIGMRHWSEHIQAQTDANADKISEEKMEDIFDRTKTAGDEDEKRYDSAVKRYEDEDGSCRKVSGASAKITQHLARCAERDKAQEPVLAAAEDGMEDWIRHLGEMRRSDKGKIHNPQQKWLATWRAAPKNINAYEKAVDKFSAPDC
jgi:hypothetical protein